MIANLNRTGRQPKAPPHHTDLCSHCGAVRAEVRRRQKAASEAGRRPWRVKAVTPLRCTRTDGRRSHDYQPRAVYQRAS